MRGYDAHRGIGGSYASIGGMVLGVAVNPTGVHGDTVMKLSTSSKTFQTNGPEPAIHPIDIMNWNAELIYSERMVLVWRFLI